MASEKETREIVEILFGPQLERQFITPFLRGKPGIGKSQLIKQIADDHGYQFIDMRLSQHDETDFKFPHKTDKHVVWLTPDTIPTEDNENFTGPSILFFDEFNRASQAVLQVIFQIVLDRRIGNAKIRDDCKIVLAGNKGAEDGTHVNQIDAALDNRIATIDVELNLKDWMEWAKGAGIEGFIMNYIEARPSALYEYDEKSKHLVSPRSWEHLSRVLAYYKDYEKKIEIAQKVCPTLIFSKTGDFISFMLSRKRVSPEEVLNKYSSVSKTISEMDRADVHQLNIELVSYIEANIDSVCTKKAATNFKNYYEEQLLDDNRVHITEELVWKANKFLLKMMEVFPDMDSDKSEYFQTFLRALHIPDISKLGLEVVDAKSK